MHGLKAGELIWTLTTPGALRIHREHFLENINRNTLEHDVTLNDVRIVFEKLGLVVGWHTEQALRRAAGAKQKTLEPKINPDAIISVKTAEGIKAVALELELSEKNLSRYRKIFADYARMRTLWGLWYVVPDLNFGKRLLKEWSRENSRVQSPQFYFLSLSEILSPDSSIKLWGVQGERLIERRPLNPAHPAA